MKLSDANLTADQRTIRMNLRNAYLAETDETIKRTAVERARLGDWFAAACLFELATEE